MIPYANAFVPGQQWTSVQPQLMSTLNSMPLNVINLTKEQKKSLLDKSFLVDIYTQSNPSAPWEMAAQQVSLRMLQAFSALACQQLSRPAFGPDGVILQWFVFGETRFSVNELIRWMINTCHHTGQG